VATLRHVDWLRSHVDCRLTVRCDSRSARAVVQDRRCKDDGQPENEPELIPSAAVLCGSLRSVAAPLDRR
jgi:hypothetical protein